MLAHAGDTVYVPIPPVLVANNIAEGGTVTPQNPSLGNAQIVLNTHAEATFQLPDVTKALAYPELLKAYMQPAVVAIASKVESDLLKLYSQFTAITPLGTAGTPVTEATIDAAESALFAAMVPPSASKYLVVDSSTYSQIRQIPRFSEYYTGKGGRLAWKALVEGNVGKIKDFFIFRSQFVPQTGTSPVNNHNLAFTRDGIGLVVRRLPQPLPGTGAVAEYAEMGNFGIRIVMSYQPNTLAQQFTVDAPYGCGVLRNNFAVQVNS